MHYPGADEDSQVIIFGLTHDTLMMEKMLLSRHKLELQALEKTRAGLQLGLFAGQPSGQQKSTYSLGEQVTKLLSGQPEWNNQELYHALLHEGLLPKEAVTTLQAMVETGKLEVLDEKKKKLKTPGSLPITQTASKLPAPSRYFRLVP